MAFVESGQVDVRKQLIDSMLTGFAKRAYKMKQAVAIVSTGAWRNDFYQASSTILTASGTRNVKGIPRGAAYPQAATSFKKIRTDIEKYGLEDSIPWEDIISGEVAIRDQTIMRIAEGVANAVDAQIYTGLTGDSGIQSFFVNVKYGATHNSAGSWNQSSAAIMDDLEYAEQLIGTQDYDTSNIFVFVNYRDKRAIMKYLTDTGAQYPKVSEGLLTAANGQIGRIGNKTFIVSQAVSASQALVVIPKKCATWKELYPLTTDVQNEPLKDVRIRAVELGVLQVTDPQAIVHLKGTQDSVA